MSKSARNVIIAVAVVLVVGVAAVPFILKATKANSTPEETVTPVTESTAAVAENIEEEITFPEEFDATTAETLAGIINELEATTVLNQAAATTTKPQAQQATTTKPQAQQATTTKPQAQQDSATKPAETTTAAKTSDEDVPDNMTALTAQEALSKESVVSYLFNPDGNFYYVEDNPWQRNFGFNEFYDWGAYLLVMYYDSFRAKFEYDNLSWMIQAWKGQYGYLFVGGEIGVYTRNPSDVGTHYNCADDNHLINMEMTVYQNFDDGNGYQKLFTRTYYPHWWSTGFVDGHLTNYKFNDRSCICMKARMTMYDATMVAAFTSALESCGFRQGSLSVGGSDTYSVSGNDVTFCWTHTNQLN